MKTSTLTRLLACGLFPLFASAAAEPQLRSVSLDGTVAGENATFTLNVHVDVLEQGTELPLVCGSVALLKAAAPSGTEIRRHGETLTLAPLPATGWWWSSGTRHGDLSITFAARSTVMGDWRHTCFRVPLLPIRPVAITGDRPDLEVSIDGARDLKRTVVAGGHNLTSAFLGPDANIGIAWKTAIRQLDAELMAACDVTTLASVGAGALRLKTIYTYQIAQGALTELLFDMPDVTITQVGGAEIQDWRVDRTDPKAPRLRVTLGRPQYASYTLTVESERPLPAFPCTLTVPVIAPLKVIRAGGTLLLGTDHAIRIQPAAAAGLTQTDPTVFARQSQMAMPSRSVFTYQYAAMPYNLSITLDDIVTALDAEIGLVGTVSEGELTVEANVQIDVRDAPAREVKLFTDADAKWTIAAVNGPQVAESDVDIHPVDGGREIVVPFRQPVSDSVLLHLRLEQPFAADRQTVVFPRLAVPGARSQRGYLIAAAEKGLRLTARTATELREVHTASTPVRVEGAQLAYRFRDAAWKLELGVERARSSIHSEVFHLVSLGEGVMYVSAAITCHISGAPVQTLTFHVPASIGALDVIGAGIDTWSRTNDLCTVQLANRTMGDYTLLLTYDQPLNYSGADLHVGDIETVGTDSELGYIAVATSAGLKLTEREALPPTLIRIGRDELPAGYAATVTAPVIGAYKYVRQPHAAVLRVTPLDTERVIDQVVDYLALSTRIGRDGEAVTRARYFVKNASRQYLSIKLPAGTALWTVRQMQGEESVRDLSCQQSGNVLLVPVDRPRDPNQAVSIEITYATLGAHGRHTVTLVAPALPETPVTYANWEIETGDRLAIGATGGNMTPSDNPALCCLLPRTSDGTQRRFYRTANLAGDEPLVVTVLLVPAWMAGGSLAVLVAATIACVALLVLALLRRKALWWALAATFVALAGCQLRNGVLVVCVTGVIAVFLLLFFVFVRWLVRWGGRVRANRRQVAMDPDEPPPFEPVAPTDDSTRSGAAACRLLLMLAMAGAAVMAAAGGIAKNQAPPAHDLPLLAAQQLVLDVRAPSFELRAERTAGVLWTMHVVASAPGSYRLLNAGSVVVKAQTSAHTKLRADADGYILDVDTAGTYDLVFDTCEQVAELDGQWELQLAAPPSLFNHFTLVVPAADMEIASGQAVSLMSSNAPGATCASGTLDTASRVLFSWKPRARVTRLEQSVVYCDVDNVAFVRAGVIDVAARVNYQVVQGEIRDLHLRIPNGVSVTAVNAPALATWSLDPATHELVAILARPVSGPFTLSLGMQIPCGGLPCDLSLGVPAVLNVQRQRGQFALAAPESILLRLGGDKPGELEGVTPVNTSDFPLAGQAALAQELVEAPLRRAFRYDDPATVHVALRAEAVQPELRVSEAGSFSIGDERDVLSTMLELTVAKAGVFGIKLQVPADYDIESLTGRDVSHWDDTRHAGQGVELFFKRRVLGSTTINLVLARPQRGIPERIDVPRVTVQDGLRHTGRMAVAAERGVRLTVDEQQGISVRKPEVGEAVQPAAVSFDILRPVWQVSLHTQVLAPALKPEVLHCVDLAEGMLQHRIYVRYRIENAGIKLFRLRVPVREATLSVSGRNIARVVPLDNDPEAAGGRVWQVELHGKVEDAYALTCFYQQPYDPANGGVTISAFNTLGVARQATWLVVTGGGRVQVEPRGAVDGLKVEDARSLPDTFGAGDLSGAIRCYRALRGDYRCDLSVVRHSAADVLPASVEQARFVTVLSSSGKLLTQATVDLKVGDLRFLKVELPTDKSTLWAALVNGAEVAASRDGHVLNVPLDNLTADKTTTVSLIYADTLDDRSLAGERTLRAPRFPDVPLRNIAWDFFVPAEFQHVFVSGDLDPVSGTAVLRKFERVDYENYNKSVQISNIGVARSNMKDVGSLLDSGKQREAQQALQVAVNSSAADRTLNEDARVQFRNVVKQQVKMGLVNRREELRRDNNIYDEQAPQTREGFNGGNFSQSFVSQVEDQLTSQDRTALDKVAQRIVDQQAAAAGEGAAINIAMPEHGGELSFRRALQSEKGGALQVVFRFAPASTLGRLWLLWPVLPLFLLLWGLFKLVR